MSAAQSAPRPPRLRSAALGAALAVTGTLGLTIGAAAPASAAAPECHSSVAMTKTVSGKLRTAQIPSYNRKITCQMVQGASGREVTALQNTLKKCYQQYTLNQNLAVDGEFGPNTKQALKNAQTAVNKDLAARGSAKRISVDGMYGPETRTYLKWAFERLPAYSCLRL